MRSAELGYPQAMYNVGRAYQFGTGVEDSMEKAIEWYEKYLVVNPDPDADSDETDRSAFYAEMNMAAQAFIALDEFVEKRAPAYGRQIDTNDTDAQKAFLQELAAEGDPEAVELIDRIQILFGESKDAFNEDCE